VGLSFLVPLFLGLGVAALAIPVWIHLRRRHERREVPFPSVRFLEGLPFRSEKHRTLRHRSLLALRALAFLLLAAAFARPFFQDDATAATSAIGPREVVVLVDRSYSMAYGDRWEAAREAAAEAVADLGAGDRATLVLFDEEAEAPVRSSPEPGRVTAALADTEPGHRATRYAPALRLARSILESSDLPNREVVLVGDLQARGWSGDEEVHLPPGTRFTPRSVAGEERWENRTLAGLQVERIREGERESAVLRATVIGRGGDGPPEGEAVLVVEGQERERIDLRRALDEAGGGTVEFGPVPLVDGFLRATVRLSPDRLSPDDVARAVLSRGRLVRVLVLDGSGGSGGEDPLLFLRRALDLSRDPPVELAVRRGGSLDAGPLAGVDVVVLNDRAFPTGPGGAALRSFVEEGGGLLVAAGPGAGTGSAPGGGDVDSFLPARPGDVAEPPAGGTRRLGAVDRSHPVFEPFRETGNLSGVRFYRTRSLAPTEDAEIVARFDDGAPALVEGRAGRGRILVWGATLHTLWTDLPLQPVFLPFLHRTVRHLAHREPTRPAYRVGDVLSLGEENAPPGVAEATTIRTPGGEVVTPAEVGGGEERRRGAVVLRSAGFYELLEDPEAEGPGHPVAVNVDPARS